MEPEVVMHRPQDAPTSHPARPKGRTFGEVASEVTALAARAYPDDVVPLSSLRMEETGLVRVGDRSLALTDWSQRLFASRMGIFWDRWFDPVDAAEMAEEVNRRLQRSTSEVRVRSRAWTPGSVLVGDGELRAILSPTYTPIDDERVFRAMGGSSRALLDRMRFSRISRTDRSTHYVATGWREHDLGRGAGRDPVFPGIHLRNSEVGYAALTVEIALFRLVCTNELVVRVAGRAILYRTHRPITDAALDVILLRAFEDLPEAWTRTMQALQRSQSERIEKPEAAITTLVASADAPKSIARRIQEELAREPEATIWTLVQAATSVARDLPDPDLRYSLERAAGLLLAA